MPYALLEKEENELYRLKREGIIEPTQLFEWVAPIVPVLNRDGQVRICDDYKHTINHATKVDQYPLPRIEDLFASVVQRNNFIKLDIAYAYQQIPVDNNSISNMSLLIHTKGYIATTGYHLVYTQLQQFYGELWNLKVAPLCLLEEVLTLKKA